MIFFNWKNSLSNCIDLRLINNFSHGISNNNKNNNNLNTFFSFFFLFSRSDLLLGEKKEEVTRTSVARARWR